MRNTPLVFPHFCLHRNAPDGKPFGLMAPFWFDTGIHGHWVARRDYSLYPDGRLEIYAGYRWDLGTGAIDDPAMIAASLEHDVFCEMVNAGEMPAHFRPQIDQRFRWRLQQYSRSWMGRAWAWPRWLAVAGYRHAMAPARDGGLP